MPTLMPGWMRVPRWRMMIVPARTACPSERFTPSILGLLSRPLRELPTPFLCAMTLPLYCFLYPQPWRVYSLVGTSPTTPFTLQRPRLTLLQVLSYLLSHPLPRLQLAHSSWLWVPRP